MLTDVAITNPFPGLRAFEEQEDVLFFGREKQVDELLKKLRTVRFLAVIGSSGSGKSSLVKSGLIPALYSGFMSGAGSQWRICTFRPGSDPIGNMARALAEDGVLFHPQNTEEQLTLGAINESILRRSSQGLVEAYRQSNIDTKNNLLILVDQFEELFRFSKLEKDAKEVKRDSVAFINLLLRATEQRELPVYVVFTMRSDFLGDCTEFRGFPEAINEGQYLVPRMTREERRDAITGPVAVGGGLIASRLINQLLNDVGDNPDQLPILQHALMRTWDIWKKKGDPDAELDIDDYEEIGTMQHALSQHAEEAYAELTSDRQRKICEVMFKALTDKASDARGIRRPRKLGEICALANAPINEVIEVVDVFRQSGRAFLMPPASVKLEADTIIDISHESLMRVWDRLIAWVDEENESAQVYLRLCEAADLYETGKGGLWRDPELQVALKWKEAQAPNATWAGRYNDMFEKVMLFLDHSRSQYELEIKHKEEQQRKRLKKARTLATFISGIALIALFLSIYSFQQKNVATKQTKLAEAKTKEALEQEKIAREQKLIAEKNREQALSQKALAEKSKEEALKQKDIANDERTKALKSEQNALLQKSIAEQQRSYAQRNEQLAKEQQMIAEEQKKKAEQNEQLAVSEQKVSNRLKDLAEARNLAYQSVLLLNENKDKESIDAALKAYDLNNRQHGPEQNTDIYNALHFNWVNSIDNKNQSLFHKYAVKSVTGKAGSNIVFSADESGQIAMFMSDGEKLQLLHSINTRQDIRSLVMSTDGSKLAAFSAAGVMFVYSITPEQAIKEAQQVRFTGIPKTAGYHNGSFYLYTSEGLSRFSADGDKMVANGSIARKDINAMTVSGTGKILLAIGNKISMYSGWDALDQPIQTFTSAGTLVITMAMDPTEHYLAAGTYKGMVWIKDLKSSNSTYSNALHLSSVNDLEFGKTADGKVQLASASSDQTIKLIDVKDAVSANRLEDIVTLRGHNKWIYALHYAANGSLISASEDNKVITWKPATSDLYKSVSALSK
ncbi:MAG: hypothetical protein EOP56_06920 [Sphingobacteriales bacterium]|nr:MAG: hypothetical protein EOP56_06920 [Sphingobacteriales bacterium]